MTFDIGDNVMGIKENSEEFFKKASEIFGKIWNENPGIFFASSTRELAEQGDAEAQCKLGAMYHNGNDEVEQNDEEAFKWLKKSAEQGNALAQAHLARTYLYGYGTKQNFQEALKWSKKSAEQDNCEGQCVLGLIYCCDSGVKQDFIEAIKWFKEAAEQGNIVGQCNLGKMYYEGHGVEQDYKEAFKWFKRAEKQAQELGGVIKQDVENFLMAIKAGGNINPELLNKMI
ncbi:MAG: sel1 repeat family protein [Endomicrobium sp.]|nr:sel1 repeat family protein [Endomicrobium sp.]